MGMLLGGFLGIIAVLVGIYYLLKYSSIALVNTPGFDAIFKFCITIIPYLVFFWGYRYMHEKTMLTQNKIASVIAKILSVIGSLFCAAAMVLSSLRLFGLQKSFLLTFEDNSQYAWILQVLILFVIAMTLASGDAKEKDWMEREARD